MDEPKKQIKAVIFDLGETLLNFGRIRSIHYFRRGARESYDFLKSLDQPVSNFEYYCWKNLLILRFYALRSAVTGNDFDSLKVLKKVGTKKGYRLTERQWQEFVWLWYKPLRDICQAEPDIIQTLTKLKDAGLKLGILSNTFVNACALEKHLEELGILGFFPVRLYSYQFNHRKPDAGIFKVAAEKIGLPLEKILYVGDRIDNDIEPTVKLGMTAVLKQAYTNQGKTPPAAVHKITNLLQLPALIEKLNALPATIK